MNYIHFEYCEAPICVADTTKGWQSSVIWYPGEGVCLKNPLSTAQKAQKKINRILLKGKLKHPDRAFTYSMLSRLKIVRPEIKGLNPEAPIKLKRFKGGEN